MSPETGDSQETLCSVAFGQRARNVELGSATGGAAMPGKSKAGGGGGAGARAQAEQAAALVAKHKKEALRAEAKALELELELRREAKAHADLLELDAGRRRWAHLCVPW